MTLFRGISPVSLKGAALQWLADQAGHLLNLVLLNFTGNPSNLETVTVNGRVYELRGVTTDTTINTSGGEWNNTVATPFTATMTAHGLTAGTVLCVGTELYVVDSVPSVNSVVLSRGRFGSTIAAHADGVDIFKQVSAGTAGRTPVYLSTLGTPATAASEFATRFNFWDTTVVRAASSGALVYLTSPNPMTVTEAGANLTATAVAGVARGTGNRSTVNKVASAGDVTAGAVYFPFPFTPTAVMVDVYTSGARVAWDGTATIVGNTVAVSNSGTTDWVAGSVIRITAQG